MAELGDISKDKQRMRDSTLYDVGREEVELHSFTVPSDEMDV